MSALPNNAARSAPTPELAPAFLNVAQRPPLGGIGARFVAGLIDGIIVGVITFPITLVLQLGATAAMGGKTPIWIPVVTNLIAASLSFNYHNYFYRKQGATPGKKLMNLRVVDFETGAFLTTKQVFWREFIGKPLSMFTLFIGYMMAFGAKKRALHDLLGGSQVLRR